MAQQRSIDWQSLLKESQDGNQYCQHELIEVLTVRLQLIIQYRCWGWSTEDQEDILQETLEVFWDKLDCISDHPDKFALRILRNKIGDELRKRFRRRNVLMNTDDDNTAPSMVPLNESVLFDDSYNIEKKIEHEEIINRFIQAIKKLKPLCKMFFAGLLEGKNINDMWEFFSSMDPTLTRSAFDTRNSRCRQKLLIELKKMSS